MSKRRRDWTAYGMPQIASRLGRLPLGLLVPTEPPQSHGAGIEDSREIFTTESPTLYWISKATVNVAAGLAANGVPSHSLQNSSAVAILRLPDSCVSRSRSAVLGGKHPLVR